MRRTLLITNDFPPRAGGIQSYLHELAGRLPARDLVVYAPRYAGCAAFDAALPFTVVRHPGALMLPSLGVRRRATELVAAEGIESVWFGAAAPLALLAPALRAHGATRVVASTHGHEVGWSMLPGARQALRGIGSSVDVLTYVSEYARRRFASAFGPLAVLEHLRPGVDSDVFAPDERARKKIRDRHGLGAAPVLLCVSRLVPRKGQDTLIDALPKVRREVPDARLLIVGAGSYAESLSQRARSRRLGDAVVFTGAVEASELPCYYNAGDVFAMPCRSRGGGLDVEGLGIVFLEASATGLPVVAGNSGGAPETVRDTITGTVVDPGDVDAVAAALLAPLRDGELAARQGAAGREWVLREWSWEAAAARLRGFLDG
ncbi:MAG: glycosyltransferase family 4 protein [Sciscionella sp.]